jgi:PTS system nitrogen regulatory IIA component
MCFSGPAAGPDFVADRDGSGAGRAGHPEPATASVPEARQAVLRGSIPRAGFAMHLSQLLNPQSVNVQLQAKSKREVIAELVDLLEKAHGLASGGEVLDRVLKRETMMSTGIGNGIAIPHGKARATDRLVAACGVSRAGVDFDSVDGQPATLFILLISPPDMGGPHVKVLANISRLLKDETVREGLKRADSPQTFLSLLREAEEIHL